MVDDFPNKYHEKMLANSKVAMEEAQKDMDSGDFNEVSDPDQEEESESREVSPFVIPEAMEEIEGDLPVGKGKQAEPSSGKVDRLSSHHY